MTENPFSPMPEANFKMNSVLLAGQNYRIGGGSDRYLVELGKALEGCGLEVIPFVAAQEENLPSPWSDYFPQGARFESPSLSDAFNFIYSKSSRQSLEKLLSVKKVNVAHLNIYYGKLTASILDPLRRRGIPIVQTLHEYKLICPVYTLVSGGQICERCSAGSYWNCVARRCNRGSLARSMLSTVESYVSSHSGAIALVDHFIAVSEFSRGKHIERGVPASKITAIPNFVTLEGVEPEAAVGDYVLYFGRVERVKGVFTLLEAAALMPTVEFLIAGSGNALDELKAEAARRQVENIRFLGHLSGADLETAIRGALCTVLPAEWYEPFGLTILESFARGRCVVGSRIGGIPEIIVHGENGLLFSPGDAAELVEHLSFLVRNPKVAAQMGRAGRLHAERKFSWRAYFEKLKEVYRHVGVSL